MYANLEFGRTIDDVNNAARIIEEKIKSFSEVSNKEKAVLEKGMFTINVLNRIEDAASKAKENMQIAGYFDNEIITRTWDNTDFFKKEDFERILNNLDVLKKSFFVYKNTPSTPTARFYFENLNDIEKILYDLHSVLDYVFENSFECGTFECGEY